MKRGDLRDILTAARDLVSKGWTQDAMKMKHIGESHFSYCATGAISAAVHKRHSPHATWRSRKIGSEVRAAIDALRCITGQYSLTYWNDHPDRTQEQVVHVFDAAIKGTYPRHS